MSSPLRPIGDLTRFGSMFWFPPGGTDNGVWASAWAELADLEIADVGPVLKSLADADVGGYIATPGGQWRGRGEPVIHRLWVDALQYHRAEDVLMAYLHRRDRRR
ncbi:hypothetical protein [Mycobacterium talmoniae]|uniref:Uncharacterized protein n=1 Tax=Mycobacterium talmoniae TaxID=1858794 RepID=A0A1S1NPA4_9MYCO|nr:MULTISPECIES: hypothetical protein [Mycobacterium]OHV05173.1 hypothetical protein BKN37_06800 [Mycobacterium talmoniae]PQM44984.1 hypothetical protein C1Y40_04852 [Mycobacterium talmoniae]TDH50183.1 hypothetical protein E2F47_18560 [Mycobacterium eburneum]